MPDTFIDSRNAANWVNHHENVSVPVAKILTVRNETPKSPSFAGMKATAGRLQQVIRDAASRRETHTEPSARTGRFLIFRP